LGGQTENTATENSAESHLSVGAIGMVSVDHKMGSSILNNTDVLSSSKANLESF